MNDDSDDSDDWATEELNFATSNVTTAAAKDEDPPPPPNGWQLKDEIDATDWQTQIAVSSQAQIDSDPKKKSDSGEPMIVVDMTALTELDTKFGNAIHCRFDAHGVNDPEAVRVLRTKIERDYETFSKDTDLVASGIVIPCGTSVWKPALSRMRLEKPGHYFCPIFPSSSTK